MEATSFRTIYQVLENQHQTRGDKTALDFLHRPSLDYTHLFLAVSRLAAHLEGLGIESQPDRSRVAIVFPNGPAMTLALLAVTCVGVAVPFNPAFQAEEYHAYFQETNVRFLLIPKDWPHPSRQVAQDLKVPILELDPLEFLQENGIITSLRHFPEPQDVALILLTSGSTGRGKKVPLTHQNLCASAMDVCRSISLTAEDRCLCMWEQFHIGGLVDLLLAPLVSGGRVLSAGGFNTALFFECLSTYRPTWFQGVPTTLRELCFHARMHEIPTQGSSLRLIRSVAAALPEPWMKDIEARFEVPVIQTFGMTEASPLITSNRLPPGKRKPGSTGQPCGPQVEIMDDSGKPVPPGTQGAIAIKGENVFSGYENDPEANSVSFRDGWFYTGDTGYFDEEGFLFISGRVKELINRGGEKILPYEVDERLLAHPALEQAATFSVPHPTLGEEVGAALVLKPNASVSVEEIKTFVAEKLAAFKAPKKIIFLTQLPRCPVGKVRRAELTQLALSLSTKAPYQPPRNPLETFLTELWAVELDVPQVGIEDDYSELGGDSLTSARLILAMENLLKIRLPESTGDHLSTVRHLAQFLSQVPECKRLLELPPTSDSRFIVTREHIQSTLKRLNGPLETAPDGSQLPLLFQQWKNARSTQELLQHRHQNMTFLTPKEVWDYLHFHSEQPGAGLVKALRSIFRWKLLKEESRWQKLLKAELKGREETFRWQRRSICPAVHLFTFPEIPSTSKTLLVGFTSLAKRLFMPIYRLLLHLDPAHFDVLLLTDPDRSHYEKGISGWAPTLEGILEKLASFSSSAGYAGIIGFGTSAGALPAIRAGIQNCWDKVLVIGPDLPSLHSSFARQLPSRETLKNSKKPQIEIAFAGQNTRDQSAVLELGNLLPHLQLLPDSRFSQHNLIEELHQRNELEAFIKKRFEPVLR